MLRMMDFLREMEMIKQADMMQDLSQVERVERSKFRYSPAKTVAVQEKGGGEVNKFMKLLSRLVLSALLLSPIAAQSQPTPQGDQPARTEQEALERWQKLTPEEKQELRERYQRWKSLSPEDKADLQKRYNNWRRLSPDEKATVRKNYERWQRLSPDQREQLQQRWQQWRELPPERRQALKERFERFRDLPPEKRRALQRRVSGKIPEPLPRRKTAIAREVPRTRRAAFTRAETTTAREAGAAFAGRKKSFAATVQGQVQPDEQRQGLRP